MMPQIKQVIQQWATMWQSFCHMPTNLRRKLHVMGKNITVVELVAISQY